MKSILTLAITFAATNLLLAADSATDDVTKAADKLAAADNYSWTTTTESTLFKPGPSHGQTEKGGYTHVDFSMMGNKLESVFKGDKVAVKADNGWQTVEEARKDEGGGGGGPNPGRYLARRMKDYKMPPTEAKDYATKAKSLSKSEDVYSGDLTADGAKALMMMTGRRGGGPPPDIKNPSGSVKFWTKDGVLSKYQVNVKGSVTSPDGDEVKIDRTTTVEIQDVGATKVTVPDDAKKKMSAPGTQANRV